MLANLIYNSSSTAGNWDYDIKAPGRGDARHSVFFFFKKNYRIFWNYYYDTWVVRFVTVKKKKNYDDLIIVGYMGLVEFLSLSVSINTYTNNKQQTFTFFLIPLHT